MQSVVIDGHAYEVAPCTAYQPLHARAGDDYVVLPVWTWADHREALSRHLDVEHGALRLDDEGYAQDLLRAAGIDEARWPSLVPLALWWAAGAGRSDASEPSPTSRPDDEQPADERLALGAGHHARLRPWTWGRRLSELRGCVDRHDGFEVVDPLAVIDRLLAAGVVDLHADDGRSPVSVEDLDIVLGHRLLAALADLNMPASASLAPDVLGDPEVRRRMLLVCGATGWTPSKVLATAAAEIDTLLALIGDAPPSPRRPAPARGSSRAGLHRHPDAVVLMFGEGG